jgi:hypothetical protein
MIVDAAYIHHHELANRYMTNMSQMTTFMANSLIFKTDNMTSVANGPGIAYTSGTSGFILGLLRRV